MRTFVIAKLTFQEAARRKILLAALIIGVLFLTVFALGVNFIIDDMSNDFGGPTRLVQSEIFSFLATAGLYVVNFLTIMLSVLTSVDTLSGEIRTGTIQSIVTKPMRRWEILVGKWFGFIGLLSLYVLLMAGGVALIMWVVADYSIPNLWKGLGLLWTNGLLMLSVSLLGGTFLSTLANGVMVFGFFGVAFVGGLIEQIGSFLENEAAINIGIISSLILPTEAIWKRAAFEMQSQLVNSLGFSPFTAGQSVPSPMMVWFAGLYVLSAIILGILIFRKRDL